MNKSAENGTINKCVVSEQPSKDLEEYNKQMIHKYKATFSSRQYVVSNKNGQYIAQRLDWVLSDSKVVKVSLQILQVTYEETVPECLWAVSEVTSVWV